MRKLSKVPLFLFSLVLTSVVIIIVPTVVDNRVLANNIIISEQMSANLSDCQTEYFYYNSLNDDEKVIYVNLLNTLLNTESSHIFSDVTESTLQRIVDYVLADHPEIFYFSSYEYVQYNNGDLKFNTVYNYTPKVIDTLRCDIDTYTNKIINKTEGFTDYEKVKYFYDYIIEHTVYDEFYVHNQFIDSVAVDRVSVCNGYAKMFQYLCYKSNIPCIFVKGIIRDTAVTHAWNLVKIDNEWYHVDCTWGDTYHTESSSVNYDFLCVTDEDIMQTHIISTKEDLPECNSLLSNYYIKEQLYFDSFNLARYQSLLDNADGCLTVRCETSEVLDEFTEYLFNEENIFNSLNTEDIYYRINKSNNSFTVYFK